MSEYLQNLFRGVSRRLRRIVMILALVITVLTAVLILLLVQLQKYREPVLTAEERIHKVVNEIDKVAVIPSDETPTVATVSDPRQLKGQPFFESALIGDQVLIFAKSKIAVLWRPSIHKVVEISSLNISNLGQ